MNDHANWRTPVTDPGRLSRIDRRAATDEFFFLRVLWRRRLTIGLFALAGVLLGGVYLFFAPKKYEATAEILIDPSLGRIVGANPAQPNFVTEASTIESQVELLASRKVLMRLAKAAHLADDVEFNGAKPGLLTLMFGGPRERVDGVDTRALADAFTVKRRERTFVAEIHAFASDPSKAADLANGLAVAYNNEQTELRIAAATAHANWLNERLAALRTQISRAEDDVEAFKSRKHVITSEGLRSNESQIMDATHELGEARARTLEAQARFDQLQRAAQSGRTESASDALKSVTIEVLRSQQAAAEREVARLSASLSARHPALIEAQAQADRQRALLADELRRIQASAQSDYESARAHQRRMERTVEELKERSNAVSRANVDLRQLEREVEALKTSYDNYAKTRDTLIEQQSNAPSAQVIAMAHPPPSASRPRVWLVLVVSLGHGILIGVAAALLIERRNHALSVSRD